jgi:hypothetical protein
VADHRPARGTPTVRRADRAAGPPGAGGRPAVDPHALREHLHSLLLWTEVLERHLGQAPEPVARALAGIRTAVRQQARIIDALDGER